MKLGAFLVLLDLASTGCANGASDMADDDADGVSEERSPNDSLLVQWVFEPTITERAEVSDALHRAFGQGLVVGELHRFGTQRYLLIRVSSEASGERITLAPIVRSPAGNEFRVGSAFDGDGNPDNRKPTNSIGKVP